MKRKGFFRKFSCAVLAVMMAAVTLSGCGGKSPEDQKNTDTAAGRIQNGTDTAANQGEQTDGERETLTIALPTDPHVVDFETNYFTKLLEDTLNVNLDFVLLPLDQNETKTKIALWANDTKTKMPDILCLSFDEMMENEYGSKGVVLPVDEYLKNPEVTPNFHKAYPEPEIEFILNGLKALDGKAYSVPRYDPFGWNESSARCWINMAWLDKLKLKMPETVDEMHDVLTAFVNGDPNGNGQKDEVGLAGSTGWSGDFYTYLMNSFLYANPNTGFFDQKDGKIFPSFTQEKWKEGLQVMNQWMSEGLIDPLSFTQDTTQLKALLNQIPEGMIGVVTSGSISVYDLNVLGKDTNKLAPPLKGPDGFVTTPSTPTMPWRLWHVTRDCKNPELAEAPGTGCISSNAF